MQETTYYNPMDASEMLRRKKVDDDKDGIGGCIRGLVYLILIAGFIFLFASMLSSCATTKPGTVVVVRDSIRTEIRTETIIVHDTIPVLLPRDSISVVTPDTTSRIETSVAISEAVIRNGMLWHSIWNKPSVDVAVEHKETVRDSIVYREKEVPVPYPVPQVVEKELSWWQQTRLKFANVMLIVLSCAAIYWLLKKKAWWLSLIKKLIQIK